MRRLAGSCSGSDEARVQAEGQQRVGSISRLPSPFCQQTAQWRRGSAERGRTSTGRGIRSPLCIKRMCKGCRNAGLLLLLLLFPQSTRSE